MNSSRGNREGALSPEFEELLRRNGLSATLRNEGGWQLVVQGRDSEERVYPLTERQMHALSGWGSNSRNKAAYRMFKELVGGDFSLPKDYVHFRNAGGRVDMGLQGVRVEREGRMAGEGLGRGRDAAPFVAMGGTTARVAPTEPEIVSRPASPHSERIGQEVDPLAALVEDVPERPAIEPERPILVEEREAELEHGAPELEHREQRAGASVDGHALAMEDGRKGWYREGAHGREVEVGEIRVEPVVGQDKKGQQELQYRMTAVVDGQHVQMSISQKEYDKFLAVDDYHRMKLFSKVSGLVDMKTRPEAKVPLGQQIMSALVGAAAMGHELTRGRPMPELYAEGVGGQRVYSKPGVDSPASVAARIFDAEMNRDMGSVALVKGL